MKLIHSKNNSIFLDTRMTSQSFAKSRSQEYLREKGLLAKISDNCVELIPWAFSETCPAEDSGIQEIEKENILLTGDAFDGFTLAELFSMDETETQKKASTAVLKVLSSCIEQNKIPENCGGEGIFISRNFNQVLFLPKSIYTHAVSCLDKEDYSRLHGKFINELITKVDAVRFLQAVISYKIISGSFPFNENDSAIRQEDIRDGNYRRIEFLVKSVPESICRFIKKALARKPSPANEFPLEDFLNFTPAEITQDEQILFREKTKKHFEKQDKRIAFRRKVRYNRTRITISSVTGIIIVSLAVMFYKTYMDKPTTKGLTSHQVIEMYYSAINTLNMDAVNQCSSKKLKSRTNMINGAFVNSKTKSMYDLNTESVSPAEWVVREQPTLNIYGLTQFMVNEKQGKLFFEGPRKNTMPKPIESEDGINISEGDTKTYSVSFYVLDTSGEDSLSVCRENEKVTLAFTKGKWIVDWIETELEEKVMPFSEFVSLYLSNQESIEFLPTDAERSEALAYMLHYDIAYRITEEVKNR